MRSLKTFLRNKKNRYCEWNKCILVWMWRDFQSYPEFCNCWYKINNDNSNIKDEETDTASISDLDSGNTDNYVEPEITDDILENPTEESLYDLNS